MARAQGNQAAKSTRSARGEPGPEDEKIWLQIYVDPNDKLDDELKHLKKRSIVIIGANPRESLRFADVVAIVPTSLFIEISEIDGVVKINKVPTSSSN